MWVLAAGWPPMTSPCGIATRFRAPSADDRVLDRHIQPANLSRHLRAVGHLLEAEDESQQWPDLHAAIRTARKTYQADGTMPDWPALEELIDRVRQPE